jgi:hypothetical protein
MRTLTISDKDANGVLAFDLRDLLNLVRCEAEDMHWTVSELECSGSRSAELQELAERGARISGRELIALAADIEQVVDGEFCAYEKGHAKPTLIFRAIDSSAWDVTAEHEHLLEAFRGHFTSVSEAGDVG